MAPIGALIFLLWWVQCQAPCCEESTLASGRAGWNKSGGLRIKSILTHQWSHLSRACSARLSTRKNALYYWQKLKLPPHLLEVRPFPSYIFLYGPGPSCAAPRALLPVSPEGEAAAEASNFFSREYSTSFLFGSIGHLGQYRRYDEKIENHFSEHYPRWGMHCLMWIDAPPFGFSKFKGLRYTKCSRENK